MENHALWRNLLQFLSVVSSIFSSASREVMLYPNCFVFLCICVFACSLWNLVTMVALSISKRFGWNHQESLVLASRCTVYFLVHYCSLNTDLWLFFWGLRVWRRYVFSWVLLLWFSWPQKQYLKLLHGYILIAIEYGFMRKIMYCEDNTV